jgi:two-component system OmpR family sensor kinase
MRRPYSIAFRLALGLSAGTGLLWAGAAGISAYVLSHELNEAYDDALRQGALRLLPLALHDMNEAGLTSLRVVTSGDDGSDGDDDADDRSRPRAALLNPYPESYSYVILDRLGAPVLRDEDAPEVLLVNGTPPEGFGQIGSERSYVLSDFRSGYSIVVLENGERRMHALTGSISALVLPLLGLVPLMAIGIWAAMRLAMRPLEKLRHDISERHGGNLSPIDASGHPAELVPIVSEVAALIDRLSAALSAERAFAAASAHELRTPIAGALAQTQQLATELAGHPKAARVRDIETALRRLARLAEKLLQLSRLGSGFARAAINTDMIPVAHLVVRDLSSTPLGEGRVRLDIAPGAQLSLPMDPDAFAMALRNLVENGLNHGETEGTVRISIGGDRRVTVESAGPPISAEVLARLGQPFERGDTKAAGSGLGLSITRAIMAEIGGELSLTSPVPGKADGVLASLIFA